MNMKKARIALILALALLALSASFLHSNLHPPSAGKNGLNFPNTVAFVFCLADLFVITFLFLFRKTTPVAAMVNGLIAIYGSILMVHHGLAGIGVEAHIPHIAMAGADLLVGLAVLRITMSLPAKQEPQSR